MRQQAAIAALTQSDRDCASVPDELRAEVVWPEEELPSFRGQLSWCQNSDLLLAPRDMRVDSMPTILLLKSTGEPLAVMRLELGERMVGCSRGLLFTAVTDQQELERLRRRRLPEVDEN